MARTFHYDDPIPLTEACFQARVWEMDLDERNLFLAALGVTRNNGHNYGLDEMPIIGSSTKWHYAIVTPRGELHVWCTTWRPTGFAVRDNDGVFVDIFQTNLAEKLYAQNLPLADAAS